MARGQPGPITIHHYYFVLSSRDGFIEDIEGPELPDLVVARLGAAKDVEHLRQRRIGGRRSWAGWAMQVQVQVQDEGGAVLFEVPFTRSAARARQRVGRGRGAWLRTPYGLPHLCTTD